MPYTNQRNNSDPVAALHPFQITYIGGPSAVLKMGSVRFLTDPTFDPAGQEFRTPLYSLRKTTGPALSPDAIGPVDVVLLSHDHHFDNLDNSGRSFLRRAGTVLTTVAGAERLGRHATGMEPWQDFDVSDPAGGILRVTATPVRHGPEGHDRGPVVGFVLAFADARTEAVYVSGDTVWYDGIAEIAKRFSVKIAVLFMGAAKVPEIGPWHLTFTGEEGVKVARILPSATIVPVHFEGWTHYSESRRRSPKRLLSLVWRISLCWCPSGQQMRIEM